jgi:two-component sensor histidine kinase
VAVAWTERGGPAVTASSGPGGYGSRLLTRAMTNQLDGSIHREWHEAGVVVTLTMNKAYLVSLDTVGTGGPNLPLGDRRYRSAPGQK